MQSQYYESLKILGENVYYGSYFQLHATREISVPRAHLGRLNSTDVLSRMYLLRMKGLTLGKVEADATSIHDMFSQESFRLQGRDTNLLQQKVGMG